MATKTGKKFSLFAVISEIFQLLLIIFLVLLNVATFGVKIPFLSQKGFNFFAVTSGSMTPAIPVGSLIKVQAVEPELLTQGDVITFNNSTDGKAVYVTHRIAEVKKTEETEQIIADDAETSERKLTTYEFITKGDANNAPDARPVPFSKVVGQYQWHIPYLGYLTAFAQTNNGFILLVIFPAVILVIWEVVSLVLQFSSASKLKSNQEIARLKEELAAIKDQPKNE